MIVDILFVICIYAFFNAFFYALTMFIPKLQNWYVNNKDKSYKKMMSDKQQFMFDKTKNFTIASFIAFFLMILFLFI